MSILTFAKILADGGVAPGLTRNDFHREIQKRAASIRRAGETAEQAYARALVEDSDSRVLFKAYKAAEPDAAPPDAKQDYVQRGPAEQEMRIAVERHRADAAALGNKLTYEQAFANVYTDPAHLPLKQRYDKETLATMTKRAAGMY
jgi:hypothetical protein